MAKLVKAYVLPLRVDLPPDSEPNACRSLRAYDPGIPGLIVHRSLGGKGWVVAHRESGKVLAHLFAKKDTAVDFCEDLEKLLAAHRPPLIPTITWEDSPETLREVQGLHEAIEVRAREVREQEALTQEQAREEKRLAKAEKDRAERGDYPWNPTD